MNQHLLIERDKIAPAQALDFLIEGNLRFTSNISVNKDLLQAANVTKDRQQPFAAILSCSDSRTTSELIFDQSLGDIFSVRLAGNIACNKAIGSLEYACRHLGSKVVVVLGHTKCGAVQAACDHFSGGHIGEIASLIAPAVAREASCHEQRNSSNPAFVDRVCELNVALQMERILAQSDMLRELLQARRIGLVGGLYDLETAIVTFPQQFRWFCLEDTKIAQRAALLAAALSQGGQHVTA
ncbi:MAG TPA: carbonic anhydrase [Methylophilaceae bacterium]|nr:carbonic anhydrase [Methylophilaceae bacterium]